MQGANPQRGQILVPIDKTRSIVIGLDLDRIAALEKHFPMPGYPEGNLLEFFQSDKQLNAAQMREVIKAACATEEDYRAIQTLPLTQLTIMANAVLLGAGSDPEGKAEEPGAKTNGSGVSPGGDSKESVAAR